ncbi:MAG: hypothetical protein ACTS22_09040 [Phycisphaerales bacterium]
MSDPARSTTDVAFPDWFKEHAKTWDRLRDAVDDHTVVVIGGARLDEALDQAIRAQLVRLPDTQDELLLPSKPLGSFSAKIDMALMLGLISVHMHKELHRLRRIRNRVAHLSSEADLSKDELRDMCMSLRSTNDLPDHLRDQMYPTPRHRFEHAVSTFEVVIKGVAERVVQLKLPLLDGRDFAMMDTEEREERFANRTSEGYLCLDGRLYDLNCTQRKTTS